METFVRLLLLFCILHFSMVHASFESYTVSLQRDIADEHTVETLSKLRRRQTGRVPTKLGQSLYWFGNFSVGDSTDLKLLIDTGSTDLILNHGAYKPSVNSKPYPGNTTFFTEYEGVNRAGFGYEALNGTVFLDNITGGGLTVTQQAVGRVTSYKYIDVPPLPYGYQGNGIIGFAPAILSAFKPQANSWVFNLCKTKGIAKCVFGLAFGTSGKGMLQIGNVAKNLTTGSIVVLPEVTGVFGNNSYTVKGDVTIDNKIVVKDQSFDLDVGTDNIQSPIPIAKMIFKLLGYPTHIASQGKGLDELTVLTAFFQCNKPPNLGFSFPAQSALKKGENATIFNVSPSVWNVFDNGNNNCTSIFGGANGFDFWLLGQPFFAGHYVNFDITANTMGFAKLKDPSMAG